MIDDANTSVDCHWTYKLPKKPEDDLRQVTLLVAPVSHKPRVTVLRTSAEGGA